MRSMLCSYAAPIAILLVFRATLVLKIDINTYLASKSINNAQLTADLALVFAVPITQVGYIYK